MDIISMPVTESKSSKADKPSNTEQDKIEQKQKSKRNADYSALFVQNLLQK
jgi:hypothetical protein